MVRTSLTSRNNYVGTGALAIYSYTFQIDLETDLLVTKEVIATGAQTTLAITTGYTVTGVGSKTGGTITLVDGNLPSTDNISIRRVVPLTQNTDIRNQGTYFPEDQEKGFDKLNDQSQQQGDEIEKSLRLAEIVDPSTFSGEITGTLVAANVARINAAVDGMEWASFVTGGNISLPAGLALMVQTAAGVFTDRTITKTGNIVVTNGDGQSGNPVIDSTTIDTNITTVQTNLDTSNKKGYPVVNMKWECDTTTTVVIEAGGRFRGVSSGDWFEFATARTFDISATKGLGAINTLVAGSATANEASSTKYILIGVGDTTGSNAPHVVAVTEAEFATFVTTDLTALGYDDFYRAGWVLNNGSSNLELCLYEEGRCWLKDPTAFTEQTSSASLEDQDVSAFFPAFVRTLGVRFNNTTVSTSNWESKTLGGTGRPINAATVIDQRAVEIVIDASGIFQMSTSAGSLTVGVDFYIDNLETLGQ